MLYDIIYTENLASQAFALRATCAMRTCALDARRKNVLASKHFLLVI